MIKQCVICGTTYSGNTNSKTCSVRCREKQNRRRASAAQNTDRYKTYQARYKLLRRRPPKSKQCVECAAPFVPGRYATATLTCGATCSAARKARYTHMTRERERARGQARYRRDRAAMITKACEWKRQNRDKARQSNRGSDRRNRIRKALTQLHKLEEIINATRRIAGNETTE